MGKTPEQLRSSARAADHPAIVDEEKIVVAGIRRKRNCLICCGCVAILVVIKAIIVVILILTVFKARDPIFRLNNVTVAKLELINGTTPRPGSNVTVNADVSVKNRNYISFKHRNTTWAIYYLGAVIGEMHVPPATERARRTMRMNVTADIIVNRVLSQPDLLSDITNSGSVSMSVYTRAGGRAKVFIIEKHVTLKMNCTWMINITSLAIQQQKCKQKFKL